MLHTIRWCFPPAFHDNEILDVANIFKHHRRPGRRNHQAYFRQRHRCCGKVTPNTLQAWEREFGRSRWERVPSPMGLRDSSKLKDNAKSMSCTRALVARDGVCGGLTSLKIRRFSAVEKALVVLGITSLNTVAPMGRGRGARRRYVAPSAFAGTTLLLWRRLGSARAQRNYVSIRACHRLPFRRSYSVLLRQYHSNGCGCNYYDILKRHAAVRGSRK